jgi:hypothetical protein
MTLLNVYTSEGCIGRCDAKCYNAHEPVCDCICGGVNHGVGLQQATENTHAYAEAMIEKYAAAHALTDYRSELGQGTQQLDLF